MKPITLRLWIPDDAPDPSVDVSQGVHVGVRTHADRMTRDELRIYLARIATPEWTAHAEILTDEDVAKIADGNAQRAYRATVQGFVDDLMDQIRAGDVTDAEGATEYLEQSIDGCHDVIYTYAAQEVLRQSENAGAYFDDFGTEGAIDDSGIQWSKLAYCALLADVREALPALDDVFQCDECNGDVTADDWRAAEASLQAFRVKHPDVTPTHPERAVCEDCRLANAVADHIAATDRHLTGADED